MIECKWGRVDRSHRIQVISQACPWPSANEGQAPGQVEVPHFAIVLNGISASKNVGPS